MPYIDYEGSITKCDRCGKVEDTKSETIDIELFWHMVIFYRQLKPNLGVFCYECAKDITPIVYRLRDIYELKKSINKLQRSINEKRNQNNRAA